MIQLKAFLRSSFGQTKPYDILDVLVQESYECGFDRESIGVGKDSEEGGKGDRLQVKGRIFTIFLQTIKKMKEHRNKLLIYFDLVRRLAKGILSLQV